MPQESRQDYSLRMAHTMFVVLFPGLEKAEILQRRAELRSNLLDALIAAAHVKAQSGKWPAKLDNLVPGELKKLPLDIYTHAARVYTGHGQGGKNLCPG